MVEVSDHPGFAAEHTLPEPARSSKTRFALIGISGDGSRLIMRSAVAPIELFGHFPTETFSQETVTVGTDFWSLARSIMYTSYHSVRSLKMEELRDGGTISRVILIWEGLAMEADVRRIKALVDRGAYDISSAVARGDTWSSVVAIAPAIAACGYAHRKCWLVRAVMSFAACSIAASLLTLAVSGLVWRGL